MTPSSEPTDPHDSTDTPAGLPFVTRVQVENYRSIAACDVSLGPLVVLAGPNAAGKSNFLDAIGYVVDALRTSPSEATAARGGLDVLLHRTQDGRSADSFRVHLHLAGRNESEGPQETETPSARVHYALEIGADDAGRLAIRSETCVGSGSWEGATFTRTTAPDGSLRFEDAGPRLNALAPDRLALSALSSLFHPHREVLGLLTGAQFYELRTHVLREPDESRTEASGPVLGPSGQHLARVLSALQTEQPWIKDTIDGYLHAMVDNAAGVDGVEILEGDIAFVLGRFLNPDGTSVKMDRWSLSEGTLRLVGVLAALFQPRALTGEIPLVVIEEPEVALYPSRVGALYDALDAASGNTQVIVSTQSADLLDNALADPAHILAVSNPGHGSVIGPITASGRALISDGVLTLPELLRSGEMQPASTGTAAEEVPR